LLTEYVLFTLFILVTLLHNAVRKFGTFFYAPPGIMCARNIKPAVCRMGFFMDWYPYAPKRFELAMASRRAALSGNTSSIASFSS